MFQLKFDNKFNRVIPDITYWKREEDIPKHIIEFINNVSDMKVIYEESTGKYYCGRCTEELDANNYCSKCNIQHKQYVLNDIEEPHKDITIIQKKEVTDMHSWKSSNNYLVFDVISHDFVILYCLTESVSYDSPFFCIPYKNSEIHVDLFYSYLIEKDGVTNLQTHDYTLFSLKSECYEKIKIDDASFWGSEEAQEILEIALELEEVINFNYTYVYTDNLVDLKNTIYKYSRIWELSDYLKKQSKFSIADFTIKPLFYSSFEYLVNYKLYNLALNSVDEFCKGTNFKEIFGVDKKFLPFMAENDIDDWELEILRLYPTTDIQVLKFFKEYCRDEAFHDLVKNTKVDLKRLKDYLTNLNLSSKYVDEYLDYISMMKELRVDLNDKKNLYPKNLRETHDALYNQIEVFEDPIMNKKIRELAHILSMNTYEDDNYIIYPASSIEELVEEIKEQKNFVQTYCGESRQQDHCIRNYCKKIANNKRQIYFMRKKTELNKSFVTIEVWNNKIMQARVKYNELPNEEIQSIINKWEKCLIPFTVQ